MPFEHRVFSLAKDAEHPDENQDACRIDPARAVAVIADGVATGIFSRRWAEILAAATLASPPDVADEAAFAAWLAEQRRAWSAGIDLDGLTWFQKPKMRQGAFSTLLWVRLDPVETNEPAAEPVFRLRARAIGDSCLLHVRAGRVLRTFPIEHSEELDADPVVLGSLDLGRDHLLEFQSLETTCRPGDLVVLCTDAVAHWALKRQEQGDPPRWDRYWGMSGPDWQREIADLRSRREMRYDDATLALLRVVDKAVEPERGETAPGTAARVAESGQPAEKPGPPPLPDWRARLKSLSGEFAEQLSQQVSRGLKQLRKARDSADEAIRKYRDRLRLHDKDDDKGEENE
jgi:hypothetical protein